MKYSRDSLKKIAIRSFNIFSIIVFFIASSMIGYKSLLSLIVAHSIIGRLFDLLILAFALFLDIVLITTVFVIFNEK